MNLKSPISNRQDLPALGALLAASRLQLAEAQEKVLQPLRTRLSEILQNEDPDFQRAALENFRKDLPKLLEEINADPATAKILEENLSAALLNGLSEPSAAKEAPDSPLFNASPYHAETGQFTSESGASSGAPAGAPASPKPNYSKKAFDDLTLPLRKRHLFGDQVVFLKGDKVITGGIARVGSGGKYIIKEPDGTEHEIEKTELRMPKGGYRGRDT
ncbi:MAG: hypothetical protein HY343_07535 [Lentisphaerae bacterium]|nr:hypothetical protein [Lentisphaerota bacterium]